MNRKIKIVSALAVVVVFVLSALLLRSGSDNPAMVVSVSSDGQYAVSSHRQGDLYLWDLADGSYKHVSQDANIYSAYFIDHTDTFIFQNTDDEVLRLNVDGAVLNTFNAPPSYGQVMTTSSDYVQSDIRWNLAIKKANHEHLDPLKKDGEGPGFRGQRKLLNLTISSDETRMLSAGRVLSGPGDGHPMTESAVIEGQRRSTHAGVVLWDLEDERPLLDFPGNSAKTHATLSPDGQYVVSVDETGKSYIWSTETGERAYHVAYSLGLGFFVEGDFDSPEEHWDNSGARFDYPDDLPDGFRGGSMVAVQFISDTEYLTFYHNQPYAVLYELGDPFALDILELGERPFPAVSDYSRNAAIATAPEANVLVTGHRDGDGITVYHYDPETRTLAREWVGRSSWWWPF